jgi:hypothetical protein
MNATDKMNATEFERLLMKISLLSSFSDFIELLESIDFNYLNEEQERRLAEVCEIKQNENALNAQVRKDAMEAIMDMSFAQFEHAIDFNSLPPFVRASIFDDDYIHIFRDTNHSQGLLRAYTHRCELVRTERDAFIANHILSIEDAAEYENRKECMDIILELTEPQFTEALKTDSLPTFVRAKVRDPDYVFLYREFSGADGYEYAFWNRQKLRTQEVEQFKQICGI